MSRLKNATATYSVDRRYYTGSGPASEDQTLDVRFAHLSEYEVEMLITAIRDVTGGQAWMVRDTREAVSTPTNFVVGTGKVERNYDQIAAYQYLMSLPPITEPKSWEIDAQLLAREELARGDLQRQNAELASPNDAELDAMIERGTREFPDQLYPPIPGAEEREAAKEAEKPKQPTGRQLIFDDK